MAFKDKEAERLYKKKWQEKNIEKHRQSNRDYQLRHRARLIESRKQKKIENKITDFSTVTFDERRRFWEKVDFTGKGTLDCWEWIGGGLPKGYGQIRVRHNSYQSHRFSYSITHGNIPKDLQVLHMCDNPPCCNPWHLFLGTNLDNRQDMVDKVRQARGSLNGMAVLNEDLVLDIKNLLSQGVTCKEISEDFALKYNTVHAIKQGRNWRHI
jgi:hypothetical protein